MRTRLLMYVVAVVAMSTGSAQHIAAPVAAASANPVVEGKRIFALNCSVGYCHGLEGRAGKGPRLRDRVWPKSYLYQTIEKGIPNSSMPAWQGRLTSQSIDAVVAYILSISREQPEAALSDPRQVATIRAVAGQDDGLGKELFFSPLNDRNCGVCHRVAGSGSPIAADLPNLSARKDRDLLRDIVERPTVSKLLQVTTTDEEAICGVKVDEGHDALRIYDLAGSGPPVLRTVETSSIIREAPCAGLNVHQTNAQFYTAEQLAEIMAFLKSVR